MVPCVCVLYYKVKYMILSAHWLGDSSHSKVEFYTLPSQLIDLYCLFFLLVQLNDNF